MRDGRRRPYQTVRIRWEIGDGDKMETRATSYLLTALLADHCDFRLEPFDDGAPPLGQQALASSTSPYQNMTLQNSDNISNLEVCMARADRVVAPAIEYFAVTIEGKRAGQLARMKAARIFDPRFVGRLGYDLGEDAVRHEPTGPTITHRNRKRHRPCQRRRKSEAEKERERRSQNGRESEARMEERAKPAPSRFSS